MTDPRVTVAIPVLDEEATILGCLDAVFRQTARDAIVEVLVIDGGSVDRTRELAAGVAGVTVLHNPGRIQAAALNVGLGVARGSVFVRIDAHARPSPDYVERALEALQRTGAAMVGGQQLAVGESWFQRGVAVAMNSALGAGPAASHVGGTARWVDTVYLGAFPTDRAREIGGYRPIPINEDADFAHRMNPLGGIWFDPDIKSTYTPRATPRLLARQFYRYGHGRAGTVRRTRGVLPRQLAAPLLLLSLMTRSRALVGPAYLGLLGIRATMLLQQERSAVVPFLLAVPIMHFGWAIGFLVGLALPEDAATEPVQLQHRSIPKRLSWRRQDETIPPGADPGPKR